LLISATPVAAGNYLALQWRMDFDPAYSRTVRLKIDSHGTREKAGAIRIALLMILHPYQQPLSMDCLRQELTRYDIGWANLDTLRRILSQFIDQKQLRQFASPFRGRQLVYCSEMYRSEPAIGDRVLELIRRTSQREGIVARFRRMRADGRLYPVVLWDERPETKLKPYRPAFESFANPDMLYVVDRVEPLVGEAA